MLISNNCKSLLVPGNEAGSVASQKDIILVAASLEFPGGQGAQASALMEGLARDGYGVSFIPINPAFPHGFRWLKRLPYIRTLFNQILYLPSLLALRHADVVHVFSASYCSFLLAPVPAILMARLFGKRLILHYHSGEAEDHLARWGIFVHPWLRLAHQIVVPSIYLQDIFGRFGYRATVIRNIIDTDRFQYRERIKLCPRLLSMRNLEPNYKIDTIITAFAILKKHYPHALLIIAGFGSEEIRLRNLSASLKIDGISFVGRVEPQSVPALYDRADIFVNAAVIDNQPVSVLEAFAAGLPVVSTGTGDIAAMVCHGQAGVIVPQTDPDAMAGAIERLLDNPEQTVAMANYARNEVNLYTWKNIRYQWAAIYMSEVT